MAPKLEYSEQQMLDAIRAVTNGMSRRMLQMECLYKVPRTTLIDKLAGRTPIERKIGRDTILTIDEENDIVSWIKRTNRRGIPPSKHDILNSVQKLVQTTPGRKTPFANDRPRKTWFQGFLRRHADISIRTPERVSKARASITEAAIRDWFEELKSNMNKEGLMEIFSDPSRVYNTDESNIQLCPKSGKVVGVKGWKNIYEISCGAEKSTLTFLGTFNARGDILCPAVIYPYVRVPKDIVRRVPDNFFVGATESG